MYHQTCRAERFTGICFVSWNFLLGFLVNFCWNFLSSANQLGMNCKVKGLKILCIREEKALDLKDRMHPNVLWRAAVAAAWRSSLDFTSQSKTSWLIWASGLLLEWEIPSDQAVKTQYEIGFMADRWMVRDYQLNYVPRGCLTEVSVGKDAYFNPSPSVHKPNRIYRFINDFQRWNKIFLPIPRIAVGR